MRIKRIHLLNYKRFTDLLIDEIPPTARLVVLIGPNGVGKSSLFDAFLLKSQPRRYNYGLEGEHGEYYLKDHSASGGISSTQEVSNTISIEFHCYTPSQDEWADIFNVRSPYRNEADFQVDTLQRVDPQSAKSRFTRIIDPDLAVSDNYMRLGWKRMADLDRDEPGHTTFQQYRKESLHELQQALGNLFTSPTLKLQDFGGLRDSGMFRFSKGTAQDFHYKNLSGGEKAAFDLLLDVFVKRFEYQNAIYCIDDPEDHIATALHGPLLEAMLNLIPEESQLWIATHSVGFVRKAHEMMSQTNNAIFLDFSGHDFDEEVKITPRVPDRSFWQTTYQVAMDDLADLIAPKNIVICEGDRARLDKGFDADCYNRIFADRHPETLFISRGSSSHVESSEDLMAVLQAVARGVKTWRLIDRDDMTEGEWEVKVSEGVRVLRRREIENYFYDPIVLRTFLRVNNKECFCEEILKKREYLLAGGNSKYVDMKQLTQKLFGYIRSSTRIDNLGNSRREFELHHLVPALKQTPAVYEELLSDVFH